LHDFSRLFIFVTYILLSFNNKNFIYLKILRLPQFKLVSYDGGTGLIPGTFMRYLLWTKWHKIGSSLSFSISLANQHFTIDSYRRLFSCAMALSGSALVTTSSALSVWGAFISLIRHFVV
jgi:hypothetical protein